MWKTIVRRLIILVPQLIALSLTIFLLAEMLPGDALGGLVGADIGWDEWQHMRAELGLDRPWTIRYVDWVAGMFQGDFGRSVIQARPVTQIVAERLGNTVRLSIVTLIFLYGIAIPFGVLAGRFKDTAIDKVIVFYTFFAIAMPTMIFAIFVLYIFGFILGWFPVLGSVDVTVARGTLAFHLSRLEHLIMPALTGAILGTAGIVNILRERLIDTENSDYVMTARSKGVPRRLLWNRHIFKNSALPIVAGFGWALVGVAGGSIFIETAFSFPGMGSLFVHAIITRDFPVANALIMFYGVLTVMGSLLADLFMMMLDPRIRIK